MKYRAQLHLPPSSSDPGSPPPTVIEAPKQTYSQGGMRGLEKWAAWALENAPPGSWVVISEERWEEVRRVEKPVGANGVQPAPAPRA